MKKIICLCLVFVIIISFTMPLNSYALSTNGLAVSDNDLTQGDEFEVYINVPANSENADTVSLKVEFDSSAFEVKSWEPVVSGGTAGMGDGYFSLAAANAERKIDLSKGLTLTATLKAKDTAKNGNYDIKLTKSSFSYVADNGYEYIELWSPTVKNVNVKVVAESTTTVPVKDDITVSESSLKANDEFEVYINIPANSQKADTASLKVEFDATAFEVKSWEPVISGGTAGKGDGYFSLAAANAERKIDLSKGLTLTATLKVKSSAKNVNYDIKLTKSSFSYVADNGYDYVELWSPVVKKVTVKVTATDEDKPNDGTTVTTTTTTPGCDSVPPEDDKPDEDTSTTSTTTTTKPSNSKPEDSTTPKVTTTPHSSSNPPVITTPPYVFTTPSGFFTTPTRTTTAKITTTTKKITSKTVEDEDSIYDEDLEDVQEESTVKDNIELSLSNKLKNLLKGKVNISTKYRFFSNDSTIILSNSNFADECAETAAENLRLEDHLCYAFDISVYDEEREEFLSNLKNDGYIDFTIPLPKELSANPSALKVYHTESGYPEFIESEIVIVDGVRKIRFRADSFSPYMIIDTINKREPDLITDASAKTPTAGNVNPNTGAAAAITIPAALVGCVLLVRKSESRKRGRNRKG